LTFLFTDIEGSTRQWEESPQMSERVDDHFAVLRHAVDQAGGEVFATLGDGIAAAFGSVAAAVQAAVAAQSRLPATGLAVRMGIHTGEVERVDDDFRGRPVNRAARIMALANGGQILLSDVTARLLRAVPSGVELVDLGTHRLRDLAEPERLWQLVHPSLERAFPAVRGVDSFANNLPVQRSSLVGRERDVQQVIELVGRFRIVTLTGVGGVGKTRLALQASADLLPRFNNVWLVELAGLSEDDDVADAIARTLGASVVTDPLSAIAAFTLGQATLLVLDNCEHLVGQVAAVVDALTARCPHVSVLATSREKLEIEGERVVAVQPLEVTTAAVELFRQRAAAAGTDIDAVPDLSIAELCSRLDGLPLAIELAAARTATLGVQAIIDGFDDRLDLLRAGRRRADDRHGTMRAAIEWSYRLLEADEQQLFLRLAAFPGGAELDAVIHVAARLEIDAATATDLVASLVHKSMVTPEVTDHGVRFRMLETVRSFALEQLDAGEGRDVGVGELAAWMRTITDLPYDEPSSAAVERNAIRLEREVENWRAAMLLAGRLRSPELAASLCGPPVAYFLLGRHDLADVVRPLLDLCDEPHHRRAALCALIVSASGGTSPEQLQCWAEEIQRIDDHDHTGLGALMRWFALAWQGDFATSIEVCVHASLDPRLRQETRDMLLGIAVLDHFSLTEATDDPHGLVERALEAGDRSEVAIHRVTCLLGAAWGLADRAPDRSIDLVRRALDDIRNVPALTRLTLPGSAARLLSRLDPRIAARSLLEQLDASPSRRSFVDLIPLFYGATLLERMGDEPIAPALDSITVSRPAPYLSMMDFVDLARRASIGSTSGSLAELETLVRSGLHALALHAAGGDELGGAVDAVVGGPARARGRFPRA
jgi:predicted ATPase